MCKFIFFSLFILLTSCSSNTTQSAVSFKSIPHSDLKQVVDSQFDRFVVTDPEVFSHFQKVIFYPMQFDRLSIDKSAAAELVDSWNDSTWDEMDHICQYFDDFAVKIFAERKGLLPTHQGGDDVLAIEFRLINFMPYGKRYKDADLGTVATRTERNGIGRITFQAVIAHSQSGQLLAVIEDGMEVNAGNMMMIKGDLALQVASGNKASQNLAWRKVFKHWVSTLHAELRRLQLQTIKTTA